MNEPRYYVQAQQGPPFGDGDYDVYDREDVTKEDGYTFHHRVCSCYRESDADRICGLLNSVRDGNYDWRD